MFVDRLDSFVYFVPFVVKVRSRMIFSYVLGNSNEWSLRERAVQPHEPPRPREMLVEYETRSVNDRSTSAPASWRP